MRMVHEGVSAMLFAWRIWLVFSLLLISTSPAQAALSPEVQKGLTWLQSQVQADGSLAGEAASIATPLQGRTESLLSLKLLASIPAPLSAAIAANAEDNTEYLARQAISSSLAGQNADALITTLVARQNADGGFGGDYGFDSNPLDTAWVMLAFKAGNFSNSSILANTAVYLRAQANPDGGYSVSAGGSNVYATAYALLAMQLYSQSYDLAAAISLAKQWLVANQNAGVYGDVLLNAVVTIALVNVTPDATSYGAVVSALLVAQLSDGSWGGDPYLSALALRAIYSAGQGPALATTGQIGGMVIDAVSHAAISNAQIQVLEVPALTAASGADGAFSLNGVPPGSYTVQISKTGYASVTVNNAVVSAGNLTSLGNIALASAPNGATLAGLFTDGLTLAPLGGAIVAVTVGGSTVSATSDAAGAYQLTSLSSGAATIAVSKAGYDTVSASAQLTAGTSITFSPSLYPTGTTPTTATLTGQVVDAAGGVPIAGAKFTLGVLSSTSDVGGNFSLTGLTAGAFSATLDATGYAGVTFSGILAPGVNKVGVIRLTKASTVTAVSGTVTDAVSKQPLGGVTVSVQGANLQVITGSDGRYRIAGITSGQFTLLASAAGYLSRSASVSITAPGDYTVDLTLDKASASGISVDSVTSDAAAYDPYSKVEAVATLSNATTQSADVTIRILVIDAKGNVVREIQAKPGLGAVNPPDLPITVPASASQAVPFTWYVLSAAAGDYVLNVRVSDSGGRVVAERGLPVTIKAAARIGGGITLDPPITQVGGATGAHHGQCR